MRILVRIMRRLPKPSSRADFFADSGGLFPLVEYVWYEKSLQLKKRSAVAGEALLPGHVSVTQGTGGH